MRSVRLRNARWTVQISRYFFCPSVSRALKGYFTFLLIRNSNSSVPLCHTIRTFWHITQPHTHWEVHFSRRSSAIQHDILVSPSVSQSVSTAAQTVRKKPAAGSLVFESRTWSSAVQKPMAILFAPTNHFVFYQGHNMNRDPDCTVSESGTSAKRED